MEINTALEKLFSLHTFGMKLGLENIQKFLDIVGSPQKKLKTIHIAGSNGKGSTAAFTASILMEFNYKVGLYTSPHFIRFNERIAVNNNQVTDEYIAGFLDEFWGYIDEYKLTFFEVTTAIAFKYFAEQNVDFAVIETGLGGRLDATNVLNSGAVIITSISLEHTNILGKTIQQIAAEKAAIIKEKSLVFIGNLTKEAYNVVEEKCRKTNSKLYRINDHILKGSKSIGTFNEKLDMDNLVIPLRGNYQKYNSTLAALTVIKFLETDRYDIIKLGIENVIKNTGLQGRYEYYSYDPDVIFDSAHNTDGVQKFLSEFKKNMHHYEKKVLLFGVMRDKSIKEMLDKLSECFDEIHITEINYERSSKIDDLQAIAEEINLKVIPEKYPVKFIEKFNGMGRGNCLVILGSMYLLGEIKTNLLKNNAS